MFTGFIRDISERKRAEEMRTTPVEFLTKPFSDQDLLEAIRIALERHRNRQEQEQQVAEFRRRFESLTPRGAGTDLVGCLRHAQQADFPSTGGVRKHS
jgi:FixJ family two-component response regulator